MHYFSPVYVKFHEPFRNMNAPECLVNEHVISKGSHTVFDCTSLGCSEKQLKQSYTALHHLNILSSFCPICLPIYVIESCILYSSTLFVYMIKLLSGKRYRAKFSKAVISSKQ